MRAKKDYQHKKLPSDAVLLAEYLRPDGSYKKMGDKYGWHQTTIRFRVKREADRLGLDWPLKTQGATPKRRKSVDVTLSANTLQDIRTRYGLSMKTIAKHVGMNETNLFGIAYKRHPKVKRETQTKILDFATRLDIGELVLPREPIRSVPRNSEVCARGHRYTGKRDKAGRICVICRTDKIRRRSEKLRREAEAKSHASEAA